MSIPDILPVILSGGAGTRLWPLSRRLMPKQLLTLTGNLTLLQETARRTAGPGFAPPLVVGNEEHRFLIAEQLRGAGIAPSGILLEPVARNTAPAIALAAHAAAEKDPDTLLLVMPSDHLIAGAAAFRAAVETGAAAARLGKLVTFGVIPDRPETGYGYIRQGSAMENAPGCRTVAGFTEKPGQETAKSYLESGDYLWNAGIFLMQAGRYLEELERYAPEIAGAAGKAIAGRRRDLDFDRPDAMAFSAAPPISVDYAVMEKTENAAVVPVQMGWNDIGAFSSLWQAMEKDVLGNAMRGDVIAEEASGCLLWSEGPAIAVAGIKDIIVVATSDAVLVVPRDQAQKVKEIVKRLKAEGRAMGDHHVTVYRPWGTYRTTDSGHRFQTKRIVVKPGEKLSLQKHHHRAEHWVVVQGTAKVTCGGNTLTLTENQSTYIPLGASHRLENPGKIPLHIIEIQSGAYLGEDDIVRFEDDYGRLPAGES